MATSTKDTLPPKSQSPTSFLECEECGLLHPPASNQSQNICMVCFQPLPPSTETTNPTKTSPNLPTRPKGDISQNYTRHIQTNQDLYIDQHFNEMLIVGLAPSHPIRTNPWIIPVNLRYPQVEGGGGLSVIGKKKRVCAFLSPFLPPQLFPFFSRVQNTKNRTQLGFSKRR